MSRLFVLRRALFFTLILLSALPAVSLAALPQPAPVARPALAPGPTATVTGDLVNIRSGPSTAYTILGRVTLGRSLEVIGKNKGATWLKVCCTTGDKQGWISASLVKANSSLSAVPEVAAPAPPPQTTVKRTNVSAPAPNVRAAGFFGYGIQVETSADKGFIIGAVKNMGFNWIKFQLPWKDFEGQPGQVDFGGLDDMIGQFNGNGLSILASIVKAPQWARAGNSNFDVEGPPADPGTYANFVRGFASRYCGRVQAIEVWNEQNLWYEWGGEPLDPGRYVQLLAAAYRAIKGACPGMIVVSGALTPTGAPAPLAMDDVAYLSAMYRAGLRSYSDAIGAHPSGFNCPPDGDWRSVSDAGAIYRGPFDNRHHSWCFRGTMEGYRNVMLANGDGAKRIWPTEFGWAVSGNPHPGYEYAADNTADEQAAWTVRAYELARSWGWVGPMFLWNLNFESGEQSAFKIYGRPTYDALRNMPK